MYTYERRIGFSEIDSDNRLTIPAIVDFFQDCSTLQSEDLGVGYFVMRDKDLMWVINSWNISISERPGMCKKVTVGTAPYSMRGFLGQRNFALWNESGEMIVKADSLWSLINTETGRPEKVPEDVIAAYTFEDKLDMDYSGRKIKLEGDMTEADSFTVQPYHLDTNKHVNNGQHIKLAYAFLPAGFEAASLRVEYRAQAFLGNVIKPQIYKNESGYIVALCDEAGAPYSISEFKGKV